MADKIVKQLPVVLQTTAIKNFFESTVEQLYSKANTEQLKGFIGKKTGEDAGLAGAFIPESTIDRREYNLTPAVNTINSITGDSENLIFYDEFMNILETYGVDTTNHNLLFGSNYQTFMPPIEIDKFINYQEYYWVPAGPTAITITQSVAAPINIEVDIIGQASFTSEDGTVLRNGMNVVFDGEYVIPGANATTANYNAGTAYIVGGVGESIFLVETDTSTSTQYGGSDVDEKDYIVLGRGANSGSAWSRVNHWYHRNNFIDSGDAIPSKEFRANRPIIEFNRHLELMNHGTNYRGSVTLSASTQTITSIQGQANLTIDTHTIVDGDRIIFPNETSANRKYIYLVSGATTSIVLTPDPSEDVLAAGDTLSIAEGFTYIGLDYVYDGSSLRAAQNKIQTNQPPLFVLYDDAGVRLDDAGLYAQSTFIGNKIFGYQAGSGTNDTELGFPISYLPFKTASEIAFENFIETANETYMPFGDTEWFTILGTYYYKLTKPTPEYSSYWKTSNERNEQKINSTYELTQFDIDESTIVYEIGATPNIKVSAPSGYDIVVKVNNFVVTNYVYENQTIKFNSFTFSAGDIIEIGVNSDIGISIPSSSRYGLPLSWRGNPNNEEIEIIAEPHYLGHFTNFMKNQEGFTGEVLGSNNYTSTAKDISLAKDIVQTDQDLILAAFMLDDQPHNLVDAIRFSSREYEKYKARLIKEITTYYNSFDVGTQSNEYILDQVLRNLISYSVGKNVFNSTYIIPYGDNYVEEIFDVVDVTVMTYTLANYLDIADLTNSLLVYKDSSLGARTLLLLDRDYTITETNPITVTIDSSITLELGETIITKLYNEERDSAQCPPTPSTMGMYPMFLPQKETDNTFSTPIDVIRGHDGSKVTLLGDIRDDILLEFEARIYNSAKKELRETIRLPELNTDIITPGAFRSNTLTNVGSADLIRHNFENWVNTNRVDPIVNEYYDSSDRWTWNYRGTTSVPGYWRGWYDYYYDSVTPHITPWELLGFFEEPTWWQTEYGTDYGSNNTALWGDLEEGIIRDGTRENLTDGSYLIDNPYRRIGLSAVLPVDSNANIKPPANITTTGTTTLTVNYTNLRDGNNTNLQANSLVLTDGLNVDYGTSNVYIVNDSIEKVYAVPIHTLANLSLISANASTMPSEAIGVTVTGKPILNPSSTITWNDEGDWQFNNVESGTTSEFGVYVITPEDAGLSEWDIANHSPIVGWAFDGLPIYGPYCFEDTANASSNIVAIQSSFTLKSGTRYNGPHGAPTGEFIQDYEWDGIHLPVDSNGYAGKNNMRYGFTIDSPSVPIYHYVVTLDGSGNPAFPYVIGGGVAELPVGSGEMLTYAGKYYATPLNDINNTTGSVSNAGTLSALTSSRTEVVTANSSATSAPWKFGDWAPVENAWKYSVGYPFAVIEGLLLSRPGKFINVFGNPTNLVKPELERFKLVSKETRKPWDYRSLTDFRIHGDIDRVLNTPITNIGYTQFIHSWLTFQGLNTTIDFADKVRTVNVKLAHRLAGFSDKDTLTVRSDQFSATGTSTSLVIPDENIQLTVHSSPYKTRNFYSGVIIQKNAEGYKVKGYDKSFGYFNTLDLNLNGRTSQVSVGGTPAPYTVWEPNKSYPRSTIVSHLGSFYQAPQFVTSANTFINTLWARLPSLPQIGAERAALYLDSNPEIVRVDYETQFTTAQEVVNFLVGLGHYQEHQGYDFGIYDNNINDIRNWTYAIKQFLFWVSGGWDNNNILELSPLGSKVKFNSTSGMVAKIDRVSNNQFTLLDQNSKSISPTECTIIREGNSIEIIPPAGSQIYAALLYTKEIEHALVIDNTTNFNDTILSTLYNQKQTRLRIKGKRTANWSGLLSTEGFIINNDELKPNLDNMAESLGRYHELGFIPVEKQIYDTARRLFGYQERPYMNDLEIENDDQFEFYTGMLQSKGTIPSLTKIARSNSIIQGSMIVFDEWALRAGDFGDLENEQSIELRLEKSDIVQDPQLITLVFPEDAVGSIDEIRILETKHRYFENPTLIISAPTLTPAVQATATVVLDSTGVISGFIITEEGSGYAEPVVIEVVAGNIVVTNTNKTFEAPVAQSLSYLPANIVTLSLSNVIISDNLSANGNIIIDVSSATDIANVVTSINMEASINANISATSVENIYLVGNVELSQYILQITGTDFTLIEDGTTLANLDIAPGRYEPRQRHSISVVGNHPVLGTGATEEGNITVTINGVDIPWDSGNNWVYHPGSYQNKNYIIGDSVVTGIDYDINGVYSGNVSIPLGTALDSNNITSDANVYRHANVYINGAEILNSGITQLYALTTTNLILYNVNQLPEGELLVGSNIHIHEHATVDLENAVLADVPGASLSIVVETNDDITILTKSKRLFEISEDSKGDEAIIIDIDDPSRFLKKPLGVRENKLWPSMSTVDYTGLTDNRYFKIPNAGYVSKSNVDFRSFDVGSINKMFSDELAIHPAQDDLIHVAISENLDWNVYKLAAANTGISFVEQEDNDETAYLFTTNSLFDYTDSNQIQETDLSRYLDYHLVLKNTQLNDKFVVWVNEQIVDSKQVRISNISVTVMTEANVTSIGPESNAVIAISNIYPGISSFSTATAWANIDGNGTVQITTNTFGIENGDTVGFSSAQGNANPLWANTYTVSNVTSSTFTILDAALTSNVDIANLVYSYYGKTQIESVGHGLSSGEMIKVVAGLYSGVYLVENASANTFVIDTRYVSGATTTGNVLLDNVIITVPNHGIGASYAGKRIAIHNADPRYYNQVYTVDSVTSNTISVSGTFSFADVANAMSNAVMTTLDHDVIVLNNSSIKVDNINSVDGIVDSINQTTDLRRGFITREGSFSMSVPMMNTNTLPTGLTSSQKAGSIPYVTSLEGFDQSGLVVTGSKTINPDISYKIGFNNSDLVQGQSPAARTITSLAYQRASTTLNISPYVRSSSLGGEDYTEGLFVYEPIEIPKISVMGPQRLLDRTINNPTPNTGLGQLPNNTGSPIINPAALVALPSVQLCTPAIPSTPPPQPPKPTIGGSCIQYNKWEYFEQSTRTANVDDTWYIMVPVCGSVKMIYDMDSGSDILDIYQTTTRTAVGGTRMGGTDTGVRFATAAEKAQLLKGNNGADASGYTSTLPQDYFKTNPGSKWCGVIEFDINPINGAYLRIDVDKNSSIYKFLIGYPSPVGKVDSQQNTNPGQPANIPPYNGVSAVPNMNTIPQTPIVRPAGTPVTKLKRNSDEDDEFRYRNSASGSRFSSPGEYYLGNFGGFSSAPMAGFGFIPSVFKKTVKITTPQNLGRSQPLASGRYVNTTMQRVSGGIVIPLATPVATPIFIGTKPIKGLDLSNDPLYRTSGDIANGKNIYFNYEPRKISSTSYTTASIGLPASIVPVSSRSVSSSTPGVFNYTPLAGDIPSTVMGSPLIGLELAPPTTADPIDSPVDVENVEFNNIPVITLIPKVKNSNGKFVPAGPMCYCPVHRPSPSVTISPDDLLGTTPGDQILINNMPITILANVEATMKSIECAIGSGFTSIRTTRDYREAIKLVSCTNAPITFKDGCRGGVYKEVLDFHIVKSFSLTDTSNTAVVPSVSGWYNSSSGDVERTATYTRYSSIDGTSFGTLPATTTTTTGSVLSSRTNHTGGSGYSVGDRLRVVGGLPIPSPYGIITELCIADPGANYTDAANVKIYIGDGSTPGAKASVGNVILDGNGGISSIQLLNSGIGYDGARPPTIRVVDLGAATATTIATQAKITAKVGTQTIGRDGKSITSYGLPDRVAKFIVTNVQEDTGAILALQVIDRGIYKQFPSDLTTGIPLEYDIINLGDEWNGEIPPTSSTGLGGYDPLNNHADLPAPGAYNPLTGDFGGGTGARVFLTAREIPDCSEKGDARSKMGLPTSTNGVNIPSHLADLLNTGLLGSGYNPTDISFGVGSINDDFSTITLESPVFDGIEIGELTPGFLEKIGIPPGDYNADMGIFSAVNTTPLNEDETLPVESIAIYGVDTLDGGMLFDGATVEFITDLFQYELRTLDGNPVIATNQAQQTTVLTLESQRYRTESDIATANASYVDIPSTVAEFANIWIDDYMDTGWAYLESNIVQRHQQSLVDPKFINSVIIYDSESGDKEFDYDMFDPFKGVLPAFIESELTYISPSDPVVYNSAKALFGRKNVGQTWWNTSTIRYNWYEQGPNRERWLNWGSAFPGSAVTVYEWIESTKPPLEYIGSGTPKNGSQFLIERRLNPTTGSHQNYYYYWVQNVEEVSSQAKTQHNRKFNTLALARYIADPNGQGLNTVGFISSGESDSTNLASMIMSNLSKTLRDDDQNIQINLSRNLNPVGLKHVSWKLAREADKNSEIPEDLSAKMIDSLCELNIDGQEVPASNLSDVERYGVKFRPRQTMFKDPQEARRTLHYVLNEILADFKLNSLFPAWNDALPSTTYIKVVNWYGVQRVDGILNKKIRYNSTYKPVYTVSGVGELEAIKRSSLADGTVIMVRSKSSERYQLWRFKSSMSGFEQIAVENETAKLATTIYTDTINSTMQAELRAFLETLRDNIFSGTSLWNEVFFEMLRYAAAEQPELDWAFKTSYLFVEKEEEDLIQRKGFNPDNFTPVLEYLNEVKPFTAKIRDYTDGKKTPLFYIKDQMISDFDKPPYPDSSLGEVRILNPEVPEDNAILSTDSRYAKWYTSYADSSAPIRTGNIRLVFDRVDWRLLEPYHNTSTSSYTLSIATNIATLNSETNANVEANANYSMSSRIFKFDPEVRTQFNADIDSYFGEGSSSNTSITQNNARLLTAIQDGGLASTLTLVQEKVGGGWRGETLDANVFTRVIKGQDTLTLQSVFGYDTTPWDNTVGFGSEWDTTIEVENYEGIFNGEVTFRRNGVTYEGFDGVTFKRLLYGEERPEELVMLSPLENFVMNVRTSINAYDGNGAIIDSISIGPYSVTLSISDANNIVTANSILATPLLENGDTVRLLGESNTVITDSFIISNINVSTSTFTIELANVDANVLTTAGNILLTSGVSAVDVEYIVHQNLFGASEYVRVLTNGSTSTTTAAIINPWTEIIPVVNISVLPIPQPGTPGVVWLNHSERVEYRKIINNSLADVTRGTRGTSISSHPSGVAVEDGSSNQVFNSSLNIGFENRDPNYYTWLNDSGSIVALSLSDITNRSNNNQIAAFLQGDITASIGWDARGWDTEAFDGS